MSRPCCCCYCRAVLVLLFRKVLCTALQGTQQKSQQGTAHNSSTVHSVKPRNDVFVHNANCWVALPPPPSHLPALPQHASERTPTHTFYSTQAASC